MKAVVFYEADTALMDKLRAVYPRHKILVDSFAKDGKVIGIGTFANISDGSMGIFRSREFADEFVKQDPFVTEGLVSKITIREWNDSLL